MSEHQRNANSMHQFCAMRDTTPRQQTAAHIIYLPITSDARRLCRGFDAAEERENVELGL